MGIGLYIRLSVEESPVFLAAQAKAQQLAASGVKESLPIIEVFRRSPREVLTAMGARFAENISYYIFTIVVVTYLTRNPPDHELPSSFVLNAVLIGAGVHLATIPMWGALSDRLGRKPAFLSELFGTRVRYSGVSVGYRLASIVAGALAPIIAVALYTGFGSGYAVSVYVAASALISILAVATYSETRHRDLAADHAIPTRPGRGSGKDRDDEPAHAG